ncbi:uncharacterized protein STEHIDRAFT_165359 [Stereum hirsutum FP-91666 SS1]|uniref:uncharacterized protein n=1 Tax=Stereum hirsutum (strain FP-91666) TaxID=721885 RepID=UPI000440FED4|nr:uncharacterized protein STEHIDRAFT_165359 [Stereum hirsutum FP-91666 SS1]EIM90883.1 hypothetical protein STEHIDRAFT_165359 [Stereum hirsutum FP-91666 SS1]
MSSQRIFLLERIDSLKAIHPNISVVEGTLEDAEVIEKESEIADIIINTASSDHWPSVKATLEGLKKNSAKHPGKPPLYIHVSGCGVIADSARGEPVEHVPEYSDIGFDLKKCPPHNSHLECDIPIVEAGTREEHRIRSIIVHPAQVYGVGAGIQKNTLWLRIFIKMAKDVGYAGTWGPGANSMNNIHVKDVASSLLFVLKAALEGKADEGAEGHYFASTMAPKISYAEWTKVMGDIMYEKGLLKEPGTRPMPSEVVDPLGNYGWSLLGSNQFSKPERLARLGWTPVHTDRISLMESLPDMIEVALAETK